MPAISITGVLIGLLIAVIFYLVATAIIVFSHSTLIFGLIALLIFLAFAFGGVGIPIRRR